MILSTYCCLLLPNLGIYLGEYFGELRCVSMCICRILPRNGPHVISWFAMKYEKAHALSYLESFNMKLWYNPHTIVTGLKYFALHLLLYHIDDDKRSEPIRPRFRHTGSENPDLSQMPTQHMCTFAPEAGISGRDKKLHPTDYLSMSEIPTPGAKVFIYPTFFAIVLYTRSRYIGPRVSMVFYPVLTPNLDS